MKVEIVQVLNDILALTKLNYNACLFGDGSPVTLRFADSVAEILTAGPCAGEPPLHSSFTSEMLLAEEEFFGIAACARTP